jgi:hypothetical protein
MSRRSILGSGVGVSGVAGCLDRNPASEPVEEAPPPTERQVRNPEPQTSGWIGDDVFDNPDKPGPFEDGQDATTFSKLATPVGGGGGNDAEFGTEIRNHEADEPAIEFSG